MEGQASFSSTMRFCRRLKSVDLCYLEGLVPCLENSFFFVPGPKLCLGLRFDFSINIRIKIRLKLRLG